MIDIKSLRQGLCITLRELAEIARITGIGRVRFTMAEYRWLTLKAKVESMSLNL